MEESKKENQGSDPYNVSKKTQSIVIKLNSKRGISKNSISSNGSKRAIPSNLASSRSMSFVSRKAFGDITSNVLLEMDNSINTSSINHNEKPLQTDPDSNVSTQI